MDADQDLPPLAVVLLRKSEELDSLRYDADYEGSAVYRAVGEVDGLARAAKMSKPYDAERQRLREALAAKDRAFCTQPLHGLKPEFFAFCEIEGESPEIQFFDTAEDASKAADAFLERAQELLADGLIEEPEIAYGRIYARCETSKGPAPDDADYDETWSFELEPRLTAEAENERLRARVAELEARLEAADSAFSTIALAVAAGGHPSAELTPDQWLQRIQDGLGHLASAHGAAMERLAKFEALAAEALRLINEPTVNLATCGMLAQKLALLAAKET